MSIVIIHLSMINKFFNWCVLVLEIIGDLTGLGYEAANILIFVIIQPSLIIIFYLLWKYEKKKNRFKRN
jgi:hypothetical protein